MCIRGRHFVSPEDEDEGQTLGGGVLGGPAEKGPIARLAAETIDKVSEAIRTLGHDTLAGMYKQID